MKRVVFWLLFVPLALVMLGAHAMSAICGLIQDCMHRYEAWSFEYEKAGWTHLGEGVWSKRE